jgi:arylsulfatase
VDRRSPPPARVRSEDRRAGPPGAPVRRLATVAPPAALLAALAGLALPGVLAGCGGPAAARAPRHVLLLTVDTLRADHLGAYGYPRATSPVVERLAADGVLFEWAIAQWPKTGPSFASMFTGQYPQSTGLTHKAAIRVPDDYLTLPELMTERGFTAVGVMSNAVLGRHLGWDRGFAEYLQTWDAAGGIPDDPVAYRRTMNAARVNELALPLLERHRHADRLFAWIHYSDPHAPYILPDGVANPFLGDRWDTGDERVDFSDPETVPLDGRRELRYYVAQYDANVRFTDEKIGELLDRARALGLLDQALVVFTADHGESLGEHGYYFGHGRLPYNDGARVPLVVSFPRGGVPRGARVERPVELVDLFPTLLELAAPGPEVPGLEGESLAPFLAEEGGAARSAAADGAAFRLAFSQAGGGSPTTHFRSVQDGTWKLIYHPRSKQGERTLPQRYELYHLTVDPGETANLLDGDAAEPLRRLRRDLFAWMKGSDWIRLPRDEIEAHGQETRQALRALGYVE